MKQIVVGQSSAADVTALLGSPTSSSNFGEETWYYVNQKQERVGVFAPTVSEQEVTAITFDANHVVSAISGYNKDQSQPVQLVEKTTPTEGHKVTFVEQMLGNLGRFNAPDHSPINDRTMGH